MTVLPVVVTVRNTAGLSASANSTITQGTTTPILPADRLTAWVPGMMGSGGIPNRTTVFRTVAPLGGGADDTANIQSAINACPVGQVVLLTAGTFTTTPSNSILINKSVTLRGAGAGKTILHKVNGATPGTFQPGPGQSAIIMVGPQHFNNNTTSTNLTTDAAKGAMSVAVASATGFSVGQIVLLDETTGGAFRTDRLGRGQIWASSDYRVVWQKHNPSSNIDDFGASELPSTAGSAGQWFCRLNRANSEHKQIASISGNTITFTTPVHISYRVGNIAQLSRYATPHTTNAGVESLSMTGGDDGNLRFEWAASCWAKNIESSSWLNEGIAIDSSFRVELREFYCHDACWPSPGGGGYAISLADGSSEILLENGICVKANKVMVSRCSGAGSVVGYCYMDMGYIGGSTWIEIGLNASHMVGCHHVLFEGNYGFNADSDQTHGNSTYMTYFRNHLRGIRAPYADLLDGNKIVNDAAIDSGPKRCAGMHGYGYWMSFVGNLLGAPGQMAGWIYESSNMDNNSIWLIGYDDISPQPVDSQVAVNIIRDGNYDFLTNSQRWHNTPAGFTMPNSLYLTSKPTFFGANPWPWVNPANGTINVLPAQARFVAGVPNS